MGVKLSQVDARRTLAERYALGAVIGRGGMGTVYRATDLVLDRVVAVKVLPAEIAEADPVSVARFEREARAPAALANAAIVTVFDAGVDEGSRFIVMEYLVGRSVETILREEGRIALERAVGIAAHCADALGAAHAAGIIHRDIKPGNVMVADDGTVKVLDFGIARALDGTALTHTTNVLGTAAYMAPEQVLGRPADERSDIYSLGCVLYAMLAGRPPFAGETVAAILHQQVNVDPQPLRARGLEVSGALEALVTQMLAKAPGDRPQSTAQLQQRLTDTLHTARDGVAYATAWTVPRRPRAHVPRGTAETATTRMRSHDRRHSRRRVAAIAVVVAGVALLAGAIATLSSGSARHAPMHRRTASKRPSRPHTTSAATTAATTAASAPAGAPKQTSTTSSAPQTPTVAGSAGALTTILTQDVEAGSIERHAAQQITNELSNILNSYELGHTANLPQELANLSQQLQMLEGHGGISPAAEPPLDADLANLQTALTRAAPEVDPPNGRPVAPATAPEAHTPTEARPPRHPGHHHHPD